MLNGFLNARFSFQANYPPSPLLSQPCPESGNLFSHPPALEAVWVSALLRYAVYPSRYRLDWLDTENFAQPLSVSET